MQTTTPRRKRVGCSTGGGTDGTHATIALQPAPHGGARPTEEQLAETGTSGLSRKESELRSRKQDLLALEAILDSPASSFPTLDAHVDFLRDALEALVAQARADIERQRHHVASEPANSDSADWQLEIWQDVIRCSNDEEVAHGQ